MSKKFRQVSALASMAGKEISPTVKQIANVLISDRNASPHNAISQAHYLADEKIKPTTQKALEQMANLHMASNQDEVGVIPNDWYNYYIPKLVQQREDYIKKAEREYEAYKRQDLADALMFGKTKRNSKVAQSLYDASRSLTNEATWKQREINAGGNTDLYNEMLHRIIEEK